MKRLIILIAALMLITTGCHKDKVEPAEHHVVTYYGNGGLTANRESSVKYTYLGDNSVYGYAEENMFINPAYYFRGWSLSPKGSVYCYPGEVIWYSGSETSLYAVWY